MKNLTEAFQGTSFKVFADVIARGESIYGLALPGEHQLTRRELDETAESMRAQKGLGLAWAKAADGAWQGPVARHSSATTERNRAAAEAAGPQAVGTLLMIAGPKGRDAAPLMGDPRLQLAGKFGLRNSSELRFLWIFRRFPAVSDYSEEETQNGVRQPSVHRASSRRSEPARQRAAQGAGARI